MGRDGARVGRDGVVQCTIYLSRIGSSLSLRFFPLQSLCLAFQVEEYSPNSLVFKEVIILNVQFNFRMNLLELFNDFYPPSPLPLLPAPNAANGRSKAHP